MAIIVQDGKRVIVANSESGVNISDLASMFGTSYGDFLFNVMADYTNNCNVISDGTNRFSDAAHLPEEKGHGYYQDWADVQGGEYTADAADILMWDRTINGQTHTFYFYSAFALADCDDTHRTWASRANKLPLLTHPHVSGISNIRVADRPATTKPYYTGELIYGRKPRWNMWAVNCGGAGARTLTTNSLYYCVFNHLNNKQELIKWNGYKDEGYTPYFTLDSDIAVQVHNIKHGSTAITKLTGGLYPYNTSGYTQALFASDDNFDIVLQGTMRTGGLTKGTAADSEFDTCMLTAFGNDSLQGQIAHWGVSFSTISIENRIVTYNKYGKILTDVNKTGAQVLQMLQGEDGVKQGYLLTAIERNALLAMLGNTTCCIMRLQERGDVTHYYEFDRIVPITKQLLPHTIDDISLGTTKGSIFIMRPKQNALLTDYVKGKGLIANGNATTEMLFSHFQQGFIKTGTNTTAGYLMFTVKNNGSWETAIANHYTYKVTAINPNVSGTPHTFTGNVVPIKTYLANLNVNTQMYSDLAEGELVSDTWDSVPSGWSSNPKQNNHVYIIPIFTLDGSGYPNLQSSQHQPLGAYVNDPTNSIFKVEITNIQ